MGIRDFFDSQSTDRSWKLAEELVQKYLPVPSHVTNLFQMSWRGLATEANFIRVIGFSSLNACALIEAAGNTPHSGPAGIEHVKLALRNLGLRQSSIVLAVELFCATLRKRDGDGPRVQEMLHTLMNKVHVGHIFGTHAYQMGLEGGMLAGFSLHCAEILLQTAYPKQYKVFTPERERYPAHARPQREREVFGCAAYQISAFVMQRLGFGPEAAVGTAVAVGKLDISLMQLPEQVLQWRAASLWIECLAQRRNYPAELDARNFFEQLQPPRPNERNQELEILYTEINRIVDKGSDWKWHFGNLTCKLEVARTKRIEERAKA